MKKLTHREKQFSESLFFNLDNSFPWWSKTTLTYNIFRFPNGAQVQHKKLAFFVAAGEADHKPSLAVWASGVERLPCALCI